MLGIYRSLEAPVDATTGGDKLLGNGAGTDQQQANGCQIAAGQCPLLTAGLLQGQCAHMGSDRFASCCWW